MKQETPGLPHHALAARQFINEEGEDGGFLCWGVSLERFSLQALSKLRLSTVRFHENLQNLRHIVSIHTHIQQVLSKSGFGLESLAFLSMFIIFIHSKIRIKYRLIRSRYYNKDFITELEWW